MCCYRLGAETGVNINLAKSIERPTNFQPSYHVQKKRAFRHCQ